MKVKNLVIGTQVQVKAEGHKGFWESSAGKLGTIVDIDSGALLDVKIEYTNGTYEWGNHKGIKLVKTNLQDVQVGDRVEILDKLSTAFYCSSKGRIGTVTRLDPTRDLDVKVEFDDGDYDWGNHKDIKRASVEPTEPSTPASIEVGSRVRLKMDKILGFLEGDVGTVKDIDGSGDAVVHFDVARNGWESCEYSIPDLHGLFVNPKYLEFITD